MGTRGAANTGKTNNGMAKRRTTPLCKDIAFSFHLKRPSIRLRKYFKGSFPRRLLSTDMEISENLLTLLSSCLFTLFPGFLFEKL